MNDELKQKRFLHLYRYAILIAAILIPVAFRLYSGTDLKAREFIPLFLGFTIWSLVPYIVLVGISIRFQNKIALVTGAVFMLAAEIWANLYVDVFSKSSTAGFLFIVMPIFQLVGIMPLSLLVGFATSKLVEQFKKTSTAP